MLMIKASSANLTNPDLFGHINVPDITEKELKDSKFCLIVDNPYLDLSKWFNTSLVKRYCLKVLTAWSSKVNKTTPVARYCNDHNIPMGLYKSAVDDNKLIKMYGCTFYNLADIGEFPRLMLIYVPDVIHTLSIPANDAIIGVNVDCVDTSTLLHLSVPGKIFGDKDNAFTEFGGFAVFHRTQGTETYNYLRYKEKTEKLSTEYLEAYY